MPDRLRRFSVCAIVLATALGACARASTTAGSTNPVSATPRWLATWSPSQSATAARPPAGTPDPVPTFVNATIREVVRTTIGGDHVRIRISNEFGDRPLRIGAALIARRVIGSTIDSASDRALTFGGKSEVVVRTGSVVTSDPIAYAVPTLSDLAVSLFLPDSTRTTTRHALGVQTTYVSKSGNHTASGTFTADTTLRSWVFLTSVEVTNARATGAIVAIGNSITDGYGATPDSNRRWPDVLARRLLTSSEPVKAVVNAGISGNQVLTFGAGPSLVARFDRDVLTQPGVTHVIVMEGINDIARNDISISPYAPYRISADDITFAYRQIIDRAHERGIVVYGATLTPFERLTPAQEATRRAINTWIRTSAAFDGVIDFDKVTRDPAQPLRLLPLYDSGDKLHPSDAGYQAMGESIDLALFRARRRE